MRSGFGADPSDKKTDVEKPSMPVFNKILLIAIIFMIFFAIFIKLTNPYPK